MDSVEIQRQKLGRRWTRGGCRKLSHGSRGDAGPGCRPELENRLPPSDWNVACMSLNMWHSPAALSFKAKLLIPAFPHYPGYFDSLSPLPATSDP